MDPIQLLYGRGKLDVNLPYGNPVKILEPNVSISSGSEEKTLRDALDNPIDSLDLSDLTRTAKKILIITSDHTRPLPSKITIPVMVSFFFHPEEFYEITILVATGLHRPMTQEEITERFGEEICRKYRIVCHDAKDPSSLLSFGKMSTGSELVLNSLVAEHNLVIAEGLIEPHFFAGFSGGRKSILPGIAGEATILANHSPERLASRYARTANLTANPVHEESLEAAEIAGLKFILNVILDKDKKIVAAFAGDPFLAFLEGCTFLEETMSVEADLSDIVITSNNGYPLDRNLYQVVKGIDTASQLVKENGVIIAVARCEDQIGHDAFRDLILSCGSVKELLEFSSTPPSEEDKWQVHILAKALAKNRVILVSEGIDRELAQKMFFSTAETVEEAIDMAMEMTWRNATINVLPEGPVVVPRTGRII
ncbi:MAG: nickel-dependent lactate racemase [Clostridiales bacterium]|nr:nickel-dependent lactate racemase [Clostridiales bacterium]